MHRQKEKVIKTHAQWHSRNQIKKIRIVMTAVLIAIVLSLAAGGLLAWSQMQELFQSGASGDDSPSSGLVISGSDSLPVYDDSLNLMLVNLSHPLKTEYQAQLVDFEGRQVDERILPALKKMMEQAKEDGCPLTLSGGYVDFSTQDQLYEAEVQRLMKEENLSRVRAESQAMDTIGKGGCNENQTGLAVTFSAGGKQGTDFASTKQYSWLSENSVYYGFILRFSDEKKSLTGMKFQPDHFRYVGTDHAVKMREYSLCLEEYVSYLRKQSQN
ncbi:MAG: M15 family metallopeptidase [Oscillospiraceae bacterium]|nr:M15 family metallopeptidase [Oscillospiraceae bacterium]